MDKGIVEELQAKLDAKPDFKDLPVTPNLLKNTKNFVDYPQGEAKDSKITGGHWHQIYYNLSQKKKEPKDEASTITAQVVSLKNKDSARAANLYDVMSDQDPWGDLRVFMTNDFYGSDVSALVFDLKNLHIQRSLYVLCQNTSPYTSWYAPTKF